MRKAARSRLTVWGVMIVLSAGAFPAMGFSQQAKASGMLGIGTCSFLTGDFDEGMPTVVMVSYLGPVKPLQFELNGYFTIPPVAGGLVTANLVFNLSPSGVADPYIVAGAGALIPYIYIVTGNLGAGLRVKLSRGVALSLDYRHWLVAVEDFGGLGSINVRLHFKL